MSDPSTPRRAFLGRLALTTAGLSAVTRAAAAMPAPDASLRTATTPWDDSWTTRLGSTHRFVFDLPQESNASPVLGQVGSLYDDYHTALGARDEDMHAVVVIRHAAIALVLNDQLWAKYKIGTANPNRDAIAAWQKRGVIFLACNMALMNRVRNFAHDSGQDEKVVEEEVRANLLPGVILQPNGVYAVLRAQDAGCVLYHVG